MFSDYDRPLSSVVYEITLERGTDGGYLAWVNEVPGCFVRAASKEEVAEKLPDTIRRFLTWIGESVPTTVEISVVDEVESAIEADEDTEVLIEADRDPLSAADWARVETWLQQSRRELLDLLRDLTDVDLAGKREGSERTVREELQHIAFVEFMYAMWTFDLGSREGLAGFLEWTRGLASERMRKLAQERARALTWAEWSGAPRPEAWTPRKAARRLIWHELLHLRAMQRARQAAEADPSSPLFKPAL